MIFYYDNTIGNNRILDMVKRQLPNDLKFEKMEIIPLAQFPYGAYNTLGVIAFYLGQIKTDDDYKPQAAFDTSVQIQESILVLNDNMEGIHFDNLNLHPYDLMIKSHDSDHNSSISPNPVLIAVS